MEIYTIGFTRKSAEQFFGILKEAGIRRLIDIRLNNTSQIAGFAKAQDLTYFLKEICGIEYIHEPLLAPTEEILKGYRDKILDWDEFERRFKMLIMERAIEAAIERTLFYIPAVLLCSEPTAERCHRRLAAEYLREKWGDLEVVHL
ncbi:MAG: DUF488 domain-containing protein [Calditrichaeota bacterium]|nr:DUF488 domain-containing protein [Calditrichota bacterium]